MRGGGFTLVPVILAMSIVAAVAFMLNRDNGLNARMITRQADIERARYAAEAGLQHANYRVQAAGCGGIFPTAGTPVVNSDFGGAAYSAHSTTVTGSPITLVSTGMYKGASVTLTRANVPVYKAMTTAVLQPDTTAGVDASLNKDFPDRNYGAEQTLRLFTGKYQPLIKFSLGTYAAGTRVVPYYDTVGNTLKAGATLSLFQTQGGSSTAANVNAHFMTTDWVEGTGTGNATTTSATWNTSNGVTAWPGGTGYHSSPVASRPHSTAINAWYDMDVTTAVAAWLDGVYPNYGLRLVDYGGSIGDTSYASSDHPTASQRPKLTLNLQQPCGSGTTLLLGLLADAYINSGATSQNYGGASVMDVSQSGPARRILVRFDVSSIPAGSTVKTATLRMYCRTITGATNVAKTLRFYYVLRTWTEGGVTWNSSGSSTWPGGGDYYQGSNPNPILATGREEASGAPAPLPGGFRQGWVDFDMQPIVQAWVDGTYNNYGMILLSESSSDMLEFDTRESAAGTAPQLVVTYQ